MENKLRLSLFLKMFIGFAISFAIAELFQLDYSYTAGVITILSLWYSKETVFKTALTRFIASLIGLGLSALIFYIWGYSLYTLFAVVFVVLLALYLLKLEFGATIALVLIGQQWAGQTSFYALNALYVLLIGTIPALLLNLYVLPYASFLDKQKDKVDKEIKTIFQKLSANEVYDFKIADDLLKTLRHDIKVAEENYVQANVKGKINYLTMREGQILTLKNISTLLLKTSPSIYKEKLLAYLALFINQIGEENYAASLKEKLDVLLEEYRLLPLPSDRKVFEERALLFNVIHEIDHFLNLKLEYHAQMN